MKSRRWFLTPELIQWRYMVECGNFCGSFFAFPMEGYRLRQGEQLIIRRLTERW